MPNDPAPLKLHQAAGAIGKGLGAAGRGIQKAAGALKRSKAPTPKGGGNYVYKGLAEGEDVGRGLVARNATASNSPISHVAGKKDTQWISTTKDINVAQNKYGQHGVVRIDLNKVTNPVQDVSGGFGRGMISNWAKKDSEVLIQGSIPAKAIKLVK